MTRTARNSFCFPPGARCLPRTDRVNQRAGSMDSERLVLGARVRAVQGAVMIDPIVSDQMLQKLGAERAQEVGEVLRNFANAVEIYFDQASACHMRVPDDDSKIKVTRVQVRICLEYEDTAYICDRGGDF